jgi:hypothetical protein
MTKDPIVTLPPCAEAAPTLPPPRSPSRSPQHFHPRRPNPRLAKDSKPEELSECANVWKSEMTLNLKREPNFRGGVPAKRG